MAIKLNIKDAATVAQADLVSDTQEQGTVSSSSAVVTASADTEGAMTVAEQGAMSLRDARGISAAPEFAWPRLALAHGVGDLANAGFANGAFVYDKQHTIATFGQEITVMFANEPKQYWKENLPGPYNPNGPMPRIFVSKEQFVAEGLTDEWVARTPPSVDPAMRMILLIKKTAEMPVTVAEVDLGDDGVWLPCVYDVDKSAYREVARLISTAFVGKCKAHPQALTFGIKCIKKPFKNSGQMANVPSIRVLEVTKQSTLDAIRNNYAA